MKLDEHIMRLIAIGASVAGNCQPCLEINLARARECGADEPEIAQAIWVGRMVRRGAWVFWARMQEISGMPAPPKTIFPSSRKRALMMVTSSAVL